MSNLKESWDLKMALAVLENKTVDADLWSEAVEWLMLYGPDNIKGLLNQASSMATDHEFPELTPSGYSQDGSLLYDIHELADRLGISAEDAKKQLQQKEQDQNIQHLFHGEQTTKVH